MGETWKPGDETTITRPPSPEVLDRWAREDKQRGITWSIITDGWLDAYRRRELTLKTLCEYTQRALERPHIPEGTRHRWLGDVVNQALAIEQRSRRKPGEPRWPWLRKISVELVERVQQQERLPVNRASANNRGHSAFERVAKIWHDHGVTVVTAAQIEKWFYPPKRKHHASPARKRVSTRKRKTADAR